MSDTFSPFPCLFVLAAALAISGCACNPGGTTGQQQAARVFVVADYDCGNLGTVTVKWTAEVAEVTAPDGSWLLPRARSGSGARYADSRHEVWEHQGALRWTGAGTMPVVCRRHTAG